MFGPFPFLVCVVKLYHCAFFHAFLKYTKNIPVRIHRRNRRNRGKIYPKHIACPISVPTLVYLEKCIRVYTGLCQVYKKYFSISVLRGWSRLYAKYTRNIVCGTGPLVRTSPKMVIKQVVRLIITTFLIKRTCELFKPPKECVVAV